MPLAPEAVPLRKLPQIWVLAAVTYTSVIAVTIASVVVYKHFWPTANAVELELEKRSARISVGDVWVPVYPNAMHQGMKSSTHNGIVEGDLNFTSPDAPAKLISFYRSRLKADYKVLYKMSGDGGGIQAIAKRGKSVITIIFAPSATGCEAQVHTQTSQ